MPFLVYDRTASPMVIVIDTDDEGEATDVAQRYALTGHETIMVEYLERTIVEPVRPVLRLISFDSFATPEDAARAGFTPPSRDTGEPSSRDEGDHNNPTG